MAIGIGIQLVGERELRAALERLSKFPRSLRRVLGRTGLWIGREARRIIRSSPHTWGPTTGKTGKSITQRLDEVSVTVGSNLRWAAVLHEGTAGLPGGAITPRGHKYLAIPALPHLRRGGVWPRDLPRGSMRFVPNARIKIGSHSWTGPALVRASDQRIGGTSEGAGVQGRDSRGQFTDDVKRQKNAVRSAGEVMFALVKRVRIRGIHYLTLPWQRGGRAFLLAEAGREAQRRWKGG